MSKSRGIYSLKVEYDKEWENITERVVIFKRLVDGLILAIKDSTGEVAVPWEVTDKISQVEIGVIGYNDNHEKIISTTAISGGNMILIAQATPNNGVEPLAPSPDIWNQIRGDIESLKNKTTQIEDTLNNKVDRDGSKVLSTNDYTDEDKDKLAGIQHGAEKNVQSDWNQTDDTADDYIKHKPENWIKTGEEKNIFICENIINSTANYVDGYCTHSSNAKRYPQKDKQFAIRGDGKNLCFLNMAITSIAAFKNWLSSEAAKNNPVRVLYPLRSPTKEEITDPALLTELKKLMEMRTYDRVTNVAVTSTGVTPELKIRYVASIKRLLD